MQIPSCNLRIGVKCEDSDIKVANEYIGCNLRIGIKYEALNLHCDTISNYNHIFVKQQKGCPHSPFVLI